MNASEVKTRNFENTIKKEITENVIRGLLMDAGYSVQRMGIENQVPYIEEMDIPSYVLLNLPKALRDSPDLFVLDKECNEHLLVQVKFRNDWDDKLFASLKDSVRTYRQIVLVYILAKHPSRKLEFDESPSGYMRCCRLTLDESCDEVMVEVFCRDDKKLIRQEPLDFFGKHVEDWWRLKPIQNIFPRLNNRKIDNTIKSVIDSISGIL